MAPWVPGRCWFRASWEGRGASSDVAGPRTGSTAPVPPPASSPPPVCSMGGGFDADRPVTSGAFFFGAMPAQTMRVWLARTPDLVHTTSTHPLPGAPKMSGEIVLHEHLWGQSPFSVRRGAEVAQRADRGDTHTTILPSFAPLGCVKPYCCLSG